MSNTAPDSDLVQDPAKAAALTALAQLLARRAVQGWAPLESTPHEPKAPTDLK